MRRRFGESALIRIRPKMVPGVFLVHSSKIWVGEKMTLSGLIEQLAGV